MSIAAEVAMKTSLRRSNAANVIPRTAPPVPTNPAMPPDNAPPSTALRVVAASRQRGRNSIHPLSASRNTASVASSQRLGNHAVARPPSTANSTDGRPNRNNRSRSMPPRNKPSLLMLLARWNSAVMPSTDWKSK